MRMLTAIKGKNMLISLALLVAIATGLFVYATQWERDFSVKSNGRMTNSQNVSYYEFEITNNTNKDIKSGTIVLACEDLANKWTAREHYYNLGAHSTITVKAFVKDVEDAKNGRVNLLHTVSVKRISKNISK